MSDTNMIASEASGRYATALLELAQEAKALKTVEKDAKKLAALFSKHDHVARLAQSPVFATEDKAASLVAICKKAKIGKLTTQFAGVVAQNGRAAEIPAILAIFNDKLAVMRGSSKAKVTSAKKLTATELKAIKSNLKKSLGQDVDIEAAVNPDLLGGFVVQIGSRLFDSSLKTKLEGIKLAMKEV